MVHQLHGNLRNLRRKVFNLDAVKLIDIDAGLLKYFARHAAECLTGLQHAQLQPAQLAVGNHQKVATTAGRV